MAYPMTLKHHDENIYKRIMVSLSSGNTQSEIGVQLNKSTRYVQYKVEDIKDITGCKTLPQLLYEYAKVEKWSDFYKL